MTDSLTVDGLVALTDILAQILTICWTKTGNRFILWLAEYRPKISYLGSL